MTLEETLLAVVASLVAAMIWLMKSQQGSLRAAMARSDRILEARDKQIGEALNHLGVAVKAFNHFERSEDEIHTAIISRLDGLGVQQEKSLEIANQILEQLRVLRS